MSSCSSFVPAFDDQHCRPETIQRQEHRELTGRRWKSGSLPPQNRRAPCPGAVPRVPTTTRSISGAINIVLLRTEYDIQARYLFRLVAPPWCCLGTPFRQTQDMRKPHRFRASRSTRLLHLCMWLAARPRTTILGHLDRKEVDDVACLQASSIVRLDWRVTEGRERVWRRVGANEL